MYPDATIVFLYTWLRHSLSPDPGELGSSDPTALVQSQHSETKALPASRVFNWNRENCEDIGCHQTTVQGRQQSQMVVDGWLPLTRRLRCPTHIRGIAFPDIEWGAIPSGKHNTVFHIWEDVSSGRKPVPVKFTLKC